MSIKNYGCKIKQSHITKPPNENHGTHLALGCSSYQPLDKKTGLLGRMMPSQCCMCINFGIVNEDK